MWCRRLLRVLNCWYTGFSQPRSGYRSSIIAIFQSPANFADSRSGGLSCWQQPRWWYPAELVRRSILSRRFDLCWPQPVWHSQQVWFILPHGIQPLIADNAFFRDRYNSCVRNALTHPILGFGTAAVTLGYDAVLVTGEFEFCNCERRFANRGSCHRKLVAKTELK